MNWIEPTLAAYLVNKASVIRIIGNRLYPNVAPKENRDTGAGLFPHVVYYRASTVRRRVYKGVVGTHPTLAFACCARDYATAKQAGEAIATALEGYVGNTPGGQIRIQGSFIDEESDGYEAPQMGELAGVHKVELMVGIYYSGT